MLYRPSYEHLGRRFADPSRNIADDRLLKAFTAHERAVSLDHDISVPAEGSDLGLVEK